MARKRRQTLAPSAELTPDDIRRIRDGLGLSQAEAGELLGGGPRAFTKYEGGIIKPAASVANLLRLLDANPTVASTLLGRKVKPIANERRGHFEVSGEHVAVLTDRKLVLLMRKLINAEALSEGVAMDHIHVAANITAPDGGEDGRIQWSEGPDRTRFLPSRLCQFQMKATKLTPAEAGEDVIDSGGNVKSMVRDVLCNGGTYIVTCGRPYTYKEIGRRAAAIRKRLASAGMVVHESQIQFRDADQVADWVNLHPSVATWLLQETQPGLAGPFRDWTHWAGRHEYDSSLWIPDERLESFREKLRQLIIPPRGVARVVGLSGYGKSRLTLEALGPTEEEQQKRIWVRDLVLYAVEQEVGSERVMAIVQNLADSGLRAIVVVDRCPQENHQDLAAMVKRSSSQLSLVTIDHEVPRGENLPDDTLLVGEAPAAVIEGILNAKAPKASDADRPRLVKLASGFPRLARLIGDAWQQDVSIASAPDKVLYNRILLSRGRSDEARVESSAMLIGAFGLVGAKESLDGDLDLVVPFALDLNVSALRTVIDDLVERGVAQMRGRLVALQPRPIALHLAERQWRLWDGAAWDRILFGSLPARLRKQAAQQLAMLNKLPVSARVAKHVCRPNGPVGSIEALCAEGNAEVISALAEIDSEAVVSLLERLLSGADLETLRAISGDARRHLVWALEKTAFMSGTFERGALLLFELALAENETWGNNATGQFKALFPVLLGNTEGGPEDRLRLLDDLLGSQDNARLALAVNALLAGAKADSFTRTVGVEIHGGRPAMKPWSPKYWNEAWSYVRECANRLAELAARGDDIGAAARKGLAGQFRTYVGRSLLDDVEQWVSTVSEAHAYWPEALTSLGDVLQYDRKGLEPDIVSRIERLVSHLSPRDLASRVRFLVTEMPWDYPIDEKLDFKERHKRQVEAIEKLAAELLTDERQLVPFFPELSIGRHRMTVEFGRALVNKAKEPMALRAPIIDALLSTPAGERNYGLLTGFMAGLAKRAPHKFEEFKQEAAKSRDLAPVLAFSSSDAGLLPCDVELMCCSLKDGIMPAFAIRSWSGGGELSKQSPEVVAPLLDLLLASPSPLYSIGLELFGMYVFQNLARLENLRPQLRLAAGNLGNAEKHHGGSHMDEHHFSELMQWILAKGNKDRDACTIALDLAQHLVEDPNTLGQEYVRPQLPALLSTFAHIVWPIIGQAIVADKQKEWRLQLTLGDSFAFDNVKRPMVAHLPADMLFAWCHAHPDVAPAFVAGIVSVLTHRDRSEPPPELDPLTRRLLDEFGDRDDVLRALNSNIHSFGWSGSRTSYYELYDEPLKSLADHRIGSVRRWTKKMLVAMHREIDAVRDEDDELKASWGE